MLGEPGRLQIDLAHGDPLGERAGEFAERALRAQQLRQPRRAVITNMHSDLDYEVLRQSLPANVVPAYDGMRLTLEQVG